MKKEALNPILPLDVYIPEGEPHVFGDRVYLYGSHDKEGGETFCMLYYCMAVEKGHGGTYPARHPDRLQVF